MTKKKTKKERNKDINSKSGMGSTLPDRRAMEKTLSDLSALLSEQEFNSEEEANDFLRKLVSSGGLDAPSKRTAVQQAQDLMYDAWESSGNRRVELAHRALEISKDCADAYVLLAEETARSLSDAKDLYEQGVMAGKRALGPKAFREDVGHFWGILETRPYMRARAGLAQCLWILGERQEAIEHYMDMLRLNPNDNQGLRYVLANCLLEEGRDEAFERLLKQYGEDASAAWLYPRALWLFRRDGAGAKSDSALRAAIKENPFVPSYLLGRKKLPRYLPESYSLRSEDEAVLYAADAIEGWRKTPGALQWLMNILFHENN